MRKGLRCSVALTVLAAGLLLLPAPSGAQCGTSTFLEVDVVVTKFYYDDRSGTPPIPGLIVGPDGTRVYEETNGQPGMQRGGAQWILYLLGLDDPDGKICNDGPNPDRLWL